VQPPSTSASLSAFKSMCLPWSCICVVFVGSFPACSEAVPCQRPLCSPLGTSACCCRVQFEKPLLGSVRWWNRLGESQEVVDVELRHPPPTCPAAAGCCCNTGGCGGCNPCCCQYKVACCGDNFQVKLLIKPWPAPAAFDRQRSGMCRVCHAFSCRSSWP